MADWLRRRIDAGVASLPLEWDAGGTEAVDSRPSTPFLDGPMYISGRRVRIELMSTAISDAPLWSCITVVRSNFVMRERSTVFLTYWRGQYRADSVILTESLERGESNGEEQD